MALSEGAWPKRLSNMMTCRQVLNLMVILGFMLNYALRVNLTIAIVAMVKPMLSHGALNATIVEGDNSTMAPWLEDSENTDDRFEWDAYQQNYVLGCFFWGYILTELPGGRLAEIIGGHRVFGHSMLWASVLTLLTPFAAKWNYLAVIIVRVLLGLMLGASWPAIHPMTAKWIPPLDRSKFIANMMASSLGAAITMPICGYLISYLGWESVFYVTGIIGLAWSLLWFLVIFDSPAQHPRISPEERDFIEKSIGAAATRRRPSRVPWTSIFTSGPVWAIIITHGCSVFGYFTVVNQLPSYMKYILHFNIKENGLLSSLPYLGKYAMAVCSSYLADHLRRTGSLTTTGARKVFTTFAVLTPGIMMLAQAFLGHQAAWSVAIFTIALTLNGAVTAGYLGNGLDIAPNFSGTIFGMANTLSSLGGFLSAFMVGSLTYENQTYGQWQIVFFILSATYGFGALIYLLLGSGELQPWNDPDNGRTIVDVIQEKNLEEALPLQKKHSITREMEAV